MIGADRAVQCPHRIALALADRVSPTLKKYALNHLIGMLKPGEKQMIGRMLHPGRANIQCSSMGRLFDAVAVLCGYAKREIAYEAEPAVYLTGLARNWNRSAKPYRFTIIRRDGLHILRLTDIIAGIIHDLQAGVSRQETAMRFHMTVAAATRKLFTLLMKKYGARVCGISGGVFQNPILTGQLPKAVYRSSRVSCTDAGLSCGQVLYYLLNEGYHVSVSHRKN